MLLFKPITSLSDFHHIQDDIESIKNWTDSNHLSLNTKSVSVCWSPEKEVPDSLSLLNLVVMSWNKFKLLSIWVSLFLRPWAGHHISKLSAPRKESCLVWFTEDFTQPDTSCMIEIYKTLIRPHLEYAAPVWAPHLTRDIANLEKVQRFGLKLCLKSWDVSYYNHLELAGLPTLGK